MQNQCANQSFIYSINQLEDLIGERGSYTTATEKIKYINMISTKMWNLLKFKNNTDGHKIAFL